MMKGDVKAAFRHLMVHFLSVVWMAVLLNDPEALVVDLSAPFGWTSSPTYYCAFGAAITWLVHRESPASLRPSDQDTECFYAYEWVDDHVLIEHDKGSRLELAATALRLGMMAAFGPRAMNEKKFSQWETHLEVLGLEFDLAARTISMPQRKIEKACSRLEALLGRDNATRSELLKLLGSLRHVCTCCRAAKPFFQRIQDLASGAPPYGSVSLQDAVKQDLHWSHALLHLGKFRDLPTTMFGAWPDPDIHLYMDASNMGLAVLDPATKRYLQLKFDDHELQLIAASPASDGFTINMREQLSIALAATVWGPAWATRFSRSVGHVWCWVDNTTAVAAVNKLASRNAMTQSLNRWIGFAEAVYGFRIRCLHLPGKIYTMADSASQLDPRRDPSAREAALRATLFDLQQQGLARNTWRQYASVWSQWLDWCRGLGRSPWLSAEPAVHSEQLALFVTYCWTAPPDGLGNAPSTVLSKISAVSWRHWLERGYPVGLHPGHLLAVQGMRRVSAPPVTSPILHALRARCNLAVAHDRVLWGAALVGYFFLLRSAEYLQVNGAVTATVVTVGDVTTRNARGVICSDSVTVARVDIHLRGSKTDQEGRGVRLALERSGSGWMCPVLAVLDLLKHAASFGAASTTPLSSIDASAVVKATTMTARLKQAAADCGLNDRSMGTHSLHSGGATAMMAAGVDLQVIRQFGRWSSDSVDRCTWLTDATTSTLAAWMATRRQHH